MKKVEWKRRKIMKNDKRCRRRRIVQKKFDSLLRKDILRRAPSSKERKLASLKDKKNDGDSIHQKS